MPVTVRSHSSRLADHLDHLYQAVPVRLHHITRACAQQCVGLIQNRDAAHPRTAAIISHALWATPQTNPAPRAPDPKKMTDTNTAAQGNHPPCALSTPNRVLKKCRSHGLPDRKAGNSSAYARLAHPGRGYRPCHSATLTLGRPGAKAPGQRPSRPWRARRPRRDGRWPRLRLWSRSVRHRRAGGGENAVRFLFPPKGAIPLPGSGRVSR